MKEVKVTSALSIKTYPDTCPIHKSCHLMGIDGKEPICPKCEQEKLSKRKLQKLKNLGKTA